MADPLTAAQHPLSRREILYPCAKGSVRETYDLLVAHSPGRPSLERLRRRYWRRFLAPGEHWRLATQDPWLRAVLGAYYRYLRQVLTGGPRRAAEDRLYRDLLQVLPVAGAAHPGLDDLEDVLGAEFARRGLRFIGGTTPPYRGPYIWRDTEVARYRVEIPDGAEDLTAYFCSGFLACGWLDFATFGQLGTAGWARPDGVYVVRRRFARLTGPQFTVELLRHEAQHLRDMRLYPDLPPEDLEYRAKLVEVVYAPSLRRLGLWRRGALDDRENAHAHSAHRVVTELDRRVGAHQWRLPALAATALDLLQEDTARLRACGPSAG